MNKTFTDRVGGDVSKRYAGLINVVKRGTVPADQAFDLLIEDTWEDEEGFSNHDSDPGGATKNGITEDVARAWGYEGAMEDLPDELALKIYRVDYYESPNYDRIAERSFILSKELFDCGVNLGPSRASMMLQRALNLLNRRGRDYPDLRPDGAIGDVTLEAADAFLAKRGRVDGSRVLLKAMLVQRGSYYMDLAARDEKFEDFLNGWLENRVDMELVSRVI